MNKKYAVCVGNNYPGTSAELSGCVNDADDWAVLLDQEGYSTDFLQEATKEVTLAALRGAVEMAGFGDRVVFTYSGHGTWLPDRDGDESDGRDEALVMADFMQGGLITDDELQGIFGNLRRGAGALILSDSCHSGTVSRLWSRSLHPKARPRFLSPAAFTDLPEREATLREITPASTPRPTASLISGCGDLEYSYDAWFGNRANGALTRTAIDCYTPGITLGRWFGDIRRRLPNRIYTQTPQLTTTTYRKYTRAL